MDILAIIKELQATTPRLDHELETTAQIYYSMPYTVYEGSIPLAWLTAVLALLDEQGYKVSKLPTLQVESNVVPFKKG